LPIICVLPSPQKSSAHIERTLRLQIGVRRVKSVTNDMQVRQEVKAGLTAPVCKTHTDGDHFIVDFTRREVTRRAAGAARRARPHIWEASRRFGSSTGRTMSASKN